MSTVFYPASNHFGASRMTALEGLAIEHRNTASPTNTFKSNNLITLDRVITSSPILIALIELISKLLK